MQVLSAGRGERIQAVATKINLSRSSAAKLACQYRHVPDTDGRSRKENPEKSSRQVLRASSVVSLLDELISVAGRNLMFRCSQLPGKATENPLPLLPAPEVVSNVWGQLAVKLCCVRNAWGFSVTSVQVTFRAVTRQLPPQLGRASQLQF